MTQIWRTALYQQIAAEDAALYIPNSAQTKAPNHKQPRYQVYNLQLRGAEDKPLYIAANDFFLPLASSLLKCQDNLLDFRGLHVDEAAFRRWIGDFENAFSLYSSVSKNFPKLADKWKKDQTPWGVGVLERPRVVIVKIDTTKKTPERLYHLVAVYPNQKNKNEFKFFTGSWQQIIEKIEIWWALKDAGGGGESSSPRLPAEITQLSGHPYIEIMFRQQIKTLRPEQSRPLFSEFSFKLMDKVESIEDDRAGVEPISLGDLKRYARVLKDVFLKDNKPFTFHRGKVSTAYNDWERGYKLWCLASTVAEGERVFRALLSVQGHKFNDVRMTSSSNRNPAKAYPTKPPQKEVLGQKKNLALRRGEAELEFRWARLVLPLCHEKVVLVSNEPKIPVDPRLTTTS